MTTLLIQTQGVPLTVNFPAIESMTVEQFYEFCLLQYSPTIRYGDS